MIRQPERSLPGRLGPMNRVVVALGRLGLRTGPVQVLTVPGRTTGRPRTTPVTPIEVDGRRFAVAALPQADWAQNARAAWHSELARGRRRTPGALEEVADPALRRRVLRAFPGQAGGGVPFSVRPGLVERGDPDEFESITDRVGVLEIRARP